MFDQRRNTLLAILAHIPGIGMHTHPDLPNFSFKSKHRRQPPQIKLEPGPLTAV